ncbi:MAG: hypothetical protein GWN84_13245 [Gammaproteobacteria bacterium]|nr:hypothetical protein [Gammaproteobacteria bacterium]NIR83795.1 hypothetical protein [Gammaproteobacteria bacterium]NIU05121.1 hypothetical protein [Gammaproteobacteria bacterium]NIV51958.1 hypothetical protein [Gammaproteobacteria bacterium]NIX86394.1 hypothetical protein [Gammaproteobacteria bacterium]
MPVFAMNAPKGPLVFVLVYPYNRGWRASCDVTPLRDPGPWRIARPSPRDFFVATGGTPAQAVKRLNSQLHKHVRYVFISLGLETS